MRRNNKKPKEHEGEKIERPNDDPGMARHGRLCQGLVPLEFSTSSFVFLLFLSVFFFSQQSARLITSNLTFWPISHIPLPPLCIFECWCVFFSFFRKAVTRNDRVSSNTNKKKLLPHRIIINKFPIELSIGDYRTKETTLFGTSRAELLSEKPLQLLLVAYGYTVQRQHQQVNDRVWTHRM
jgi:hypothetical protein